jgi:hypothetical protein
MSPNVRRMLIGSTAVAGFLWLAMPAEAQRSGARNPPPQSSKSEQKSHGQAQSQGGGRQSAPPPPARNAQPPSRPAQSAGPAQGPSRGSQPPSGYQSGRGGRGAEPPSRGGYLGQATPRQAPPPAPNNYRSGGTYGSYGPSRSYDSYRGPSYNSYGRATPSYGPSHGRYSVRPQLFERPFYSFRPRFSLGFGIFVGYPIAYPFSYYDPYGYYNFRIGIQPGYRTYSSGWYNDNVGGIAFDIDPYDAAVFIDGEYVGLAGDFSSTRMPLTVSAGRHHIDLRADGFMTVSFDITVVPGQVIPYEGTMPFGR